MNLQEFRKQYPQYDDTSDGNLAYMLWQKSYKNSMPMGLFADQINLSSTGFKEMVDSAKSSGYRPTDIAYAENYVPPLARPLAFLRGATLGLSENISAAAAAAMDKDKPFSEGFSDYLNLQRDMIGQYQSARPKEAFAVEMAGGIAPSIATGGASTLVKAGTSPSVMSAAAKSGASGVVYGAATSEGDLTERLKAGSVMAIPSALFGGGTQALFNIASPAIKAIVTKSDKTSRQPTVETLRDIKNRAYKAVSDAGIVVDEDATTGLYNASQRIARLREYNPDVDTYTKASLDLLERQADKRLTVNQLDRVRQSLWDRYKQSGYSEQAIRDMIDEVDLTIQRLPGDNDFIKAARLANSRYRKSEVISEAFDKAERSATAAGTGGNVVNRYKQVVNNILNDKKQTRYFDDSEVMAMRNFVDFTPSEQVLRVIGKLDPTSNGLMTALNVAAVATEPTMAGLSALGFAARRASEGMTTQKGEALFEKMATGVSPIINRATSPAGVAPIVLSEYEREQNKLRGK